MIGNRNKLLLHLTTARRHRISMAENTFFSKIIQREIPADIVFQDERVTAFRDINPQAPTHVLVIPKGTYESMDDFSKNGTEAEITGFFRAVGKVARDLGAVEAGYRFLANNGADAHQEVPHFHVHIFAGRDLGGMIKRV